MEAKAKVKKVRAKPEIARIAESKGASERIVHANGPTVLMTKMTKVHPGKVDLRGTSQKNLQAWRHLMMRENGVGPDGTESPDGESDWIKGQHSTSLQMTTKGEQVSGGLTHLVQRNEEGAHGTWMKVVVVGGRFGSGGERTAEEHVSRHVHRCRREKTLCVSISHQTSQQRRVYWEE